MIPDILNSGNFDLIFKGDLDKELFLGPIVNEYKMYTDNEGVYLHLQLISPTDLLDLPVLHNVKTIQLDYLHETLAPLVSYQFGILGYSWEFEGKRGNNNMLFWEVVFAVKRETITIIKHERKQVAK
jgi:hypothetical protein